MHSHTNNCTTLQAYQEAFTALLEAYRSTAGTNTDEDRRRRQTLREEASRIKALLSDVDFLHAGRWEAAEHDRFFPKEA